MALTAETIEAYFKEYGWHYEQLDETTYFTGFSSDVSEDVFPIYVTLSPNWVYFAIIPFVESPNDPECERKLYKHLLRLCQEINMAKFYIDADGDVVLAVELPRENLDYSEFADALNILAYYAEDTYPTVHALATDPNAVSGFEENQDLD